MSLPLLAWRQLASRGVRHVLTALVVALGVGLVTATTASVDAARTAMSTAAERHPLVVGPEVGAVPLVLGTLTRLQDLEAGIDAQVYQDLVEDPRVDEALPMLAGHAVAGYPLLATTPAWLSPRSRFPLAEGRVFEADAAEVVLGYEAAAGLGVRAGGSVTIEHGHAAAPEDPGTLRVVGVLAPTRTGADRTLFCGLQAIHASHAGHHHDESPAELLSSVLVRPVDDASLLSLQEDLDARPGVAVALTGQTLRRVAEQVASGGRLLEVLVTGVVLITFLTLLLSIYGTTLEQARDIAVMRVLGARRLQVVGVVALVTLGVVAAGLALGLGLGALLGGAAETVLRDQVGLEATVVLLSPTTVQILAATALVLLAVGAQPAWEAYAVQAHTALSAVPGSGRATRTWARRSLNLLIPIGILIWLNWAMSEHGTEAVPVPLDDASRALFEDVAAYTLDTAPADLAAVDGAEVSVRGWMYALGDPFEVGDFYLIPQDPRLPRCPFCYRAPTKAERIAVKVGGRTLDVSPSQVEVRGVLHLDRDGDDPVALELAAFDVVLP